MTKEKTNSEKEVGGLLSKHDETRLNKSSSEKTKERYFVEDKARYQDIESTIKILEKNDLFAKIISFLLGGGGNTKLHAKILRQKIKKMILK